MTPADTAAILEPEFMLHWGLVLAGVFALIVIYVRWNYDEHGARIKVEKGEAAEILAEAVEEMRNPPPFTWRSLASALAQPLGIAAYMYIVGVTG